MAINRTSSFCMANSVQNASCISALPFLYCTRTLQSKVTRSSIAINPVRKWEASRNFCNAQIGRAAYDAIPFAQDDPNLLPRKTYKRLDSLPSYETTVHNPNALGSTITASEQEVFTRIFDDLARSASPGERAEENEFLDEDIGDPDTYLKGIFDAALRGENIAKATIGGQHGDPKARFARHFARQVKTIETTGNRDSIISRYPPSLRQAAARVSNLLATKGTGSNRRTDRERVEPGRKIGEPEDEGERNVLRASKAYRADVEGLLQTAQTDVEIWIILERMVFGVMSRLNVEMAKEREENEILAGRKQRRKSKVKWKANVPPPGSAASEPLHEQLPPLLLLEDNYASLCVHALRLLRRFFPMSPYTMCLLPEIKRLGPESYVLGTSTGLYNEILYVRWKEYNDLNGIVDLAQEMRDKGITIDAVTLSLLRAVIASGELGVRGRQGTTVKIWWEMQSRTNIKRLEVLYKRLRSDYITRRQTASRDRAMEDELNSQDVDSAIPTSMPELYGSGDQDQVYL